MLSIFWRYWKNKGAGQISLSSFLMCGIMICGWLLLLNQTALATPPLYPGMGGGHKDDVAPMHHRMAGEEGRLLAPGAVGIGGTVYTTGTVSVIALLVEFPDVKFTKNQAYFQDLMDKFARYYRQNSYGNLDVQYTVASQTVLSNNMAYYGNRDDAELIKDAVTATDSKVDFNNYNALIIIHAGQGEESSRVSGDIHSQFVYNSVSIIGTKDGVGVFGASIVPEHEGSASPFGIFCHEFGHQLGLPDLYDTTGSSEGIGNWSLMSAGAWNGSPQGSSPAHFDAWCKIKLDWIIPQTITTTLIHQAIPQAETSPVVYKLWNNTMDTKEYFLVENRQGNYLPGKGLLIWHVDENQTTNNDPKHYMIALEQADGWRHLENKQNRGDAGDPYPGSTVNRYFDDRSNPNSRTYQGTSTYIAVENISDSAATMTANLSIVPITLSLISPVNGSITSTNTPTFEWTPLKDASTYTLMIGTHTYVVGTTSYRPTTPLADAKYSWQVMSNTQYGTVSSSLWYFWVDAIPEPPSVPILLSPINNQTISQQKPTFRWEASTDPDPGDEVKYILWYSNGSSTEIGTISSNSYTTLQRLDNATYYWRVGATDGTLPTAWSETGTFTIKMITENGGTVTGSDGTTTLIFPSNAVTGTISIDILLANEIETGIQQAIDAATNVMIDTSTIRQIEITEGQRVFFQPVTIQLPYFGTTTTVAIYRLTPTPYNRWEMLPSIVNRASQTVRSEVYCFSVFGVGVAPVADDILPASIISSVSNWPNPFIGGKESTTIYYILEEATNVSINIYNPIGELVWDARFTANSNGARQGANEISWDGKNGRDERVSQGIYFCVIEARGSREIRRIGVR